MYTKLFLFHFVLVALELCIKSFTRNLPELFTGLLKINYGKVSKLE